VCTKKSLNTTAVNKFSFRITEMPCGKGCDHAATEKEIKAIFDSFDTNKNGFIESGEVEQMVLQFVKGKEVKLDPTQTKAAVEAYVKSVDSNNDGKISLKEFSDFVIKFL